MKWPARLSIRWLLMGQFLVVVAAALTVVGVLTVYWRLPMAMEQQRAEQRRAAGIALLRVEANLELAERRLQTMQRTLRVMDGRSDGWPLPRLLPDDDFLAIYRLDGAGRVLRASLRETTTSATPPSVQPGHDLSNLPVLRLAAGRSGLVWGDQYLSPITGVPVVALALPLGDGYLMAELSVDRLGDSAAGLQALEGLALLVTDGKGEVVRSPNAEDRLHRRNLRDQPVIAEALQRGAAHGRLRIDGAMYEGHALRMDRIGWVVYAGYPVAVAEVVRRSVLFLTSVTVGVAIVVGLGLLSLTAAWLQRRLQRSIAYAEAVAAGQYPPAPQGSAIFEIAALEQGLADMAQRIQQREQQLRAIVDLGPTVAIQVYDRDTRVLEWNPASERILGFSREQALGKRPVDLYYTAEQQTAFEAILREIEKTGQAYGPLEGEIRDAHGHPHWIYSTTFPIPGPRPGEPHFVCMDIDITELKRLQQALRELNASLEEKVERRTRSLQQANAELQRTLQELQRAQAQLVQADKLAALGSLVAGVAHELNTPIGNALMAVSTLGERLRTFQTRMVQGLRRSDLDAFVEQVATAEDIALRNLHRAADLVTSFKQVAVDQTSSQRRTFDLAELVREILLTLQPVLKRAPVTVEVDVPAGIAMDSYPGPLGQVLSNLIQNALVHGLADRPQGRIRVAAEVADGWVTLHVSDDGCGIPTHLHERIFEPFFTTRLGQGGSGLGLHIAHNIVTGMLGGRITFDSEVDRGTTFHIACPSAAPRDANSGSPTAAA